MRQIEGHNRNLDQDAEEEQVKANPLQQLTAALTANVKQLLIDLKKDSRYKYIVHVKVGENNGQGMIVGTRTYWDDDADDTVSVGYKNDAIFVLV